MRRPNNLMICISKFFWTLFIKVCKNLKISSKLCGLLRIYELYLRTRFFIDASVFTDAFLLNWSTYYIYKPMIIIFCSGACLGQPLIKRLYIVTASHLLLKLQNQRYSNYLDTSPATHYHHRLRLSKWFLGKV